MQMENARSSAIPVVDGHCDTVHLFFGSKGPYVFSSRNPVGHVDLPRLRQGGVKLQFFALYIEPEFTGGAALGRTLMLTEAFLSEMEKAQESVLLIRGAHDLETMTGDDRLGALLALEGAQGVENTDILHILYRLGLRSVGLTWNHRNHLADGVGVGDSAGGLTPAGKDMVREMNRLGILVDASHVAPRGFFDILAATDQPIAVTHANAYGVCPHRRNLSDDQLRALRDTGGVVGMSFYPPFVERGGVAGLEELLNHFTYIAERFGTDILGIGSDFDGISRAVSGLEDVSRLPVLAAGLERRGFSRQEVENILGGNFLRLLGRVLRKGRVL
jgi:membrane dipeptidase